MCFFPHLFFLFNAAFLSCCLGGRQRKNESDAKGEKEDEKKGVNVKR